MEAGSTSKGVNKHGLSRNIPAEVQRRVRQECGFGCVICGLAIVQYEHIDPPFSEACEHDPKLIALLCGSCHDHVTRGFWSKEKVANARRNPVTFKEGYSHDAFEIGPPFVLQVGQNRFENVRTIVRQGTNEWFRIDAPESEDAPCRISATFFDAEGHRTLEIRSNEWICETGVWDLEVKGRVIEVRPHAAALGLRIRTDPPSRLIIERLSMKKHQVGIEVDESGVITLIQGDTKIQMDGTNASVVDTVFQLP